jgi:hypothetical protein
MKVQKRVKTNQAKRRRAVTCQNVGVERKQEVILIRSDIDKMTEDEIKELLKKISNENKEFHKMYYAQNTPVMQIKSRTFSDLLIKFIKAIKAGMDFRLSEATAQYRRK